MKAIPFRDVLWGTVYKMGMDPARKLLRDQAESVVSYINAWVRRLYPIIDMPEWTKTEPRAPDVNNIVSYERAALPPIERIFKVYLSDPTKDGTAFDTPFRMMENGVHVGFEHGPQVWLKFIEQAPRFTHEEWDQGKTYGKGNLSYSPAVGECFKSKANSNHGHDPSDILGLSIDAATTQQFSPGTPAIPAQPKIMHIDYSSVAPLNVGTQIIVNVFENHLIVGSATYTSVTPATTPAVAFASIRSQLILSLDGYTITQDNLNVKLILESPTEFSVNANYLIAGGPDFELDVFQDQPLIPVIAAVPAVRQISEIIFSPTQAVPLATYDLSIIDGAGAVHGVEYVAQANADGNAIILGLIQAIADSGDPFFGYVFSSIDPDSVKLTLSFAETVSVDLTFLPMSSAWWERVLFPLDLADQVMRGAYADLLKEQGQADKATAEEQLVPTENAAKTATLASQPYDALTDQQRPRSRYKVA